MLKKAETKKEMGLILKKNKQNWKKRNYKNSTKN